MKKFLKILLIVFAMYATAKWPRQIVFGVEFGYHLVSGAVTNLFLYGRPGTGKTHLLCASLREAVFAGHTARFVIEDDLFRMVKETYGGKSSMSESQVLAYFGDVDYLAIDDMGRSRWTPEESAILMRIINRRYNDRKYTAISTNLTPTAIQTTQGTTVVGLDGYLGEGVMRRLEPAHRIMATWEPYRMQEAK
jgi:DNA replication protein DnaC